MTKRGANRGDERLEARRNEGLRRERGKAPVLAVGIEGVGRCADSNAGQELSWIGANLGAFGIEADGKIADHADLHAGVAQIDLCPREGDVGDPLQEQKVIRWRRSGRGFSLELRMPLQGSSTFAHKGAELGRKRRAMGNVVANKTVIEVAQQAELRGGILNPVD